MSGIFYFRTLLDLGRGHIKLEVLPAVWSKAKNPLSKYLVRKITLYIRLSTRCKCVRYAVLFLIVCKVDRRTNLL